MAGTTDLAPWVETTELCTPDGFKGVDSCHATAEHDTKNQSKLDIARMALKRFAALRRSLLMLPDV